MRNGRVRQSDHDLLIRLNEQTQELVDQKDRNWQKMSDIVDEVTAIKIATHDVKETAAAIKDNVIKINNRVCRLETWKSRVFGGMVALQGIELIIAGVYYVLHR